MSLILKILVALALAALAYRILSAFLAKPDDRDAPAPAPKTLATDLELCPRCKTYIARSEPHACAGPQGPKA